jgi:hypothetical protein
MGFFGTRIMCMFTADPHILEHFFRTNLKNSIKLLMTPNWFSITLCQRGSRLHEQIVEIFFGNVRYTFLNVNVPVKPQ